MEPSYEINRRQKKPFTIIVIVVLALVSEFHLLRLFLDWEVIIDAVVVPMWGSVLGFVIAGGLALMLWIETGK